MLSTFHTHTIYSWQEHYHVVQSIDPLKFMFTLLESLGDKVILLMVQKSG